jgi:starch-binding outer membrane protein, SusD/RagB family
MELPLKIKKIVQMKNKINFFLLILTLLGACNKKLDVPPQNTLTPDQIKSADDVKAVLFGGYFTMQNAASLGEKYNTLGELLISDGDIDWAGTFAGYGDIFENSQLPTANEIYQVWANSYHTINTANIVLGKLDVLTGDEKTEIEGEAKFLRAICYYYLVNFFALPYSAGNTATNSGVPLILAPVSGFDPERDKLPRASVEAVYTQIVNDLKDGAAKMPDPDNVSDFRASKYSATALLSRVYLSQQKYAEAAIAADDVIKSGFYGLTNTYAEAFNNNSNSSEDIFAIQQTSQSNSGTTNFGITTFYSGDPEGRGEIQISPSHLSMYEAADDRKAFFYDGSSISGQNGKMTGKWRELYKAIPVIRLAEMYLTRAEANFRKGGTPTGPAPVVDVNTIRDRAGLGGLGAIADAGVIVDERHRELAFEGERLFTVRRLKLSINGNPFDFPKLILPIPQREIDLGSALPQNPSY